jgi:hypothetical protein
MPEWALPVHPRFRVNITSLLLLKNSPGAHTSYRQFSYEAVYKYEQYQYHKYLYRNLKNPIMLEGNAKGSKAHEQAIDFLKPQNQYIS